MKDIHITLHGLVPSKKNSRITTRTGRSFPSKRYTEWHKYASEQLLVSRKCPSKPIERLEAVHIQFWSKDRRKWDISNKAESCMDLLVDNGFILDDNYAVVPKLNLEYMGVDKKKQGITEITLYMAVDNL